MAFTAKKLEGEWVTLDCDPASNNDEKTWFFIRPLTALETNHVYSNIHYTDSKTNKSYFNGIELSVRTVSAGLKDVKNFIDCNGKQVELKLETVKHAGKDVERVPMSFIDLLPQEVLSELSLKIQNINVLSEQEKDDLNFTNE